MERDDEDDILKMTGRRVRALRKQKGITKEKLAEAGGITAQHIGNIESGRKCVNFIALSRIAKALGTSMDYLVFGAQATPPEVETVNQELMELAPVERRMLAELIQNTAKIVRTLRPEE